MITDRESIPIVEPDGIPDELKENALFLVWRAEDQGGGKLSKVPYNFRTGEKARGSGDAYYNAGGAFDEVYDAYENGDYDGLGVYMTRGYGAIDLDNALHTDGHMKLWALEIVERVGGYAEISPSGNGIRIFFSLPEVPSYIASSKEDYKAKFKEKAHPTEGDDDEWVEVYIPDYRARYATITGNALLDTGEPSGFYPNNLIVTLEQYLSKTKKRKVCTYERKPRVHPCPQDFWTDDHLLNAIRKSKQGEKFKQLYDIEVDYNIKGESENDLALFNILVWWTNHDTERVRRLLFKSNRVRKKWEKRDDYMDRTLLNACSLYDGKGFNPGG